MFRRQAFFDVFEWVVSDVAQVRVEPLKTGKRWFVVKSLPRKEALAAMHLKRQNFEAFLPLLAAVSSRISGGELGHRTSFFPGYLFVLMDIRNDRWRSVNGTIGVSTILQSGGQPAPVPLGLVEELKSRTNAFGELGFEDKLETGAAVRIVGGPFDRLLAIFQELDGEGRAKVLLELMGRPITVSLGRASVIAV